MSVPVRTMLLLSRSTIGRTKHKHACISSLVRRMQTSCSIKDEVAKFDQTLPVERASTPPASWYKRSEFHELEKESIFARHWIAVGVKDNLQRPGDYITGYLGDEPYLVTVAEDGSIRAYYNVCRHHATLLMDDPQGHAKDLKFQCPYHGWTYGLDGRLTQARTGAKKTPLGFFYKHTA